MQTATSKPLLEPGDHLTREEFHRRYELRPDIKKAELIYEVVYVPTRLPQQGVPIGVLTGWLVLHQVNRPDFEFAVDGTFRPGPPHSEVQPDIVAWYPGRNARVDQEGYLAGVPEMAIEISASSASYDLHEKKRLYAEIGIPEYLCWRTIDGEFDWFFLIDGEYQRRDPDAEGRIESTVFPGLTLNVANLLAGGKPASLRA